MLEQRICMS